MDLLMNNHRGKIPGNFSKGCSLRSFRMNNNQLDGLLPQSLVNCSNLELLDVGNNYLNDTFPGWLGESNLRVLVLRTNRFYGHIINSEAAISSFSHLRIIYVSHNDFFGHLPTSFFQNLHAIRDEYGEKVAPNYIRYLYSSTVSYDEYVSIVTNGLEREFTKILNILTVVDFSSNRFIGQIPEILGELSSLIVINLSHNSLTGPIPSVLGNLSALESLDLSSNKLQGSIPPQLKNLGFLAVLNLSQNNLTGPIPQGNQFGTLTNNSYTGNLGLYGFPLSKSCGDDQEPPKNFHGDDDALNWKFSILIGYGCGVVLRLSIGYIVFTTRKPWWFIRIIERLQQKYVGRKTRRNGGRK